MHSYEMNKIEVRNVEKYPFFAVFLVVFFIFEILRENYFCELGIKYAYKWKTMKKTEKLHRRK